MEQIFSDQVIVSDHSLKADEYYYVPYEQDGETISFAGREDCDVVQLVNMPQTQMLAKTAVARKAE